VNDIIDDKILLKMIKDTHIEIIDDLRESLKMYVGKDEDKLPLISTGFKLQHKETGLIYTVIESIIDDVDGICIMCEKPQGGLLKISCKDLKKYRRL
jgi:hypothetical protein